MSGTFTYRSPTTPAGAGWSEDLGTEAVRLGMIDGITTQAQLGSVDITSIPIDDPDSSVGHSGDGIVGLKQFDWRESECPVGRRVIFTGYVLNRTYTRGDDARSSLITGVARWIDVSLGDINSFLSFRLLVDCGDSGDARFNRPAETDIVRVQALLDIFYLSTTLYDGIIATTGGVAMDAVDYTGQRPVDVLNDCAQQSGRNFFVFYDEAGTYTGAAGRFGLFYENSNGTVYPSSDPDFQVSNVLEDCDQSSPGVFTGPTWPPLMDARLEVDPTRIVTGVSMAVGKTSVYEKQLTTSYKFAWRDMEGSSSNVKTVAQATARADRYLSDLATEEAKLTFSLHLPAANVNDWREGQWATVKFSHLGTDAIDLTDFTRVRCNRRTVKQDEETDAFYNVEYECTPIQGEPSGAVDSGLVGVSYSGTPELPRPTTPGNVLLAIMFAAGNTTRFPTSFRAKDNPAVSPASPETPPFSALQTAAWTVIGKAVTDYSGQSTGGPCGVAYGGPFHGAFGGVACTSGLLVVAAWRYVAPGEVTTKPAQFSTEITDSQTTTYLWELPTATPPDGTYVESDGNGGGNPSTATLPTISGNVVAAIQWAFAAGHGATTQPLSPTVLAGTSLRGPMKTAPGAHAPTLLNSTTVDSNTSSWGWLLTPSGAGIASARVTASAAGGGYNAVNWCGIAVRLPPGIELPDIPYPANQSA